MKIGKIQTDYIFDTTKFAAAMAKASAHMKRMIFIMETARIMAPRPFLPRSDSRFIAFLREQEMDKKKCGECGQDLPALVVSLGVYETRGGGEAVVDHYDDYGGSYVWDGYDKEKPIRKCSWIDNGRFQLSYKCSIDLVKRIRDLEQSETVLGVITPGVYRRRDGEVEKIHSRRGIDTCFSWDNVECAPGDYKSWCDDGRRYLDQEHHTDLVKRIGDLEESQGDEPFIEAGSKIKTEYGKMKVEGVVEVNMPGGNAGAIIDCKAVERPAIAIEGIGVYRLRNGDVTTITVDDGSDTVPFGGKMNRKVSAFNWWWKKDGRSHSGNRDVNPQYDVVERIGDLPYDESQMKKWARWRAWTPLFDRWWQFECKPTARTNGWLSSGGGRAKPIKKSKAPPAPTEGVRWQDTLKESEK